jgi:hypothetical protein
MGDTKTLGRAACCNLLEETLGVLFRGVFCHPQIIVQLTRVKLRYWNTSSTSSQFEPDAFGISSSLLSMRSFSCSADNGSSELLKHCQERMVQSAHYLYDSSAYMRTLPYPPELIANHMPFPSTTKDRWEALKGFVSLETILQEENQIAHMDQFSRKL